MKNTFKGLLILAASLVLFLIFLIVYIDNKGIPYYEVKLPSYQHTTSPEIIERGKKLSLMLCATCHTNRETGKLTGYQMLESPKEFGIIRSKNITQDKVHGIGDWTDAEILYLLRTGIKKDGQYIPPYMMKLTVMADEDVNAIIAFLRSDDALVAADPTPDPDSELSFMVKALTNIAWKPYPYPTEPIIIPDTTDQLALGKYYAQNMDCFACHSADFKSNDYYTPELSEGYFGGGTQTINAKGQVIATANLTPHPAFGIGSWTVKEFIRAVRFGLKDGSPPLRRPMLPYTHLTEYEVASIFKYLQSIPSIENKVDRVFYQ
ncbi:MAG: cytochrome c [Reichenbachiella sp.]